MRLDLFLEEPSAEAALRQLVPAILGDTRGKMTVRYHAFQGIGDLFEKLPGRLRALKRGAPPQWRIVVLVDEDRASCTERKKRLETILADCGITTKSAAAGSSFDALTRIAVEEVEAWLLGDPTALRAAYPRLKPDLARKSLCTYPDQVPGGTAEALEKLLKSAGYHQGGLPKIEAARRIAAYMDPSRNHSPSFRCFRDGLRKLVAPTVASAPPS